MTFSKTPSLPLPAGGSPVPVHPGLQGGVPADLRASGAWSLADTGREGVVGAQRRPRRPQEGHRVRDQSAAVLQRVPGHGQRIQDGQDLRGRYGDGVMLLSCRVLLSSS